MYMYSAIKCASSIYYLDYMVNNLFTSRRTLCISHFYNISLVVVSVVNIASSAYNDDTVSSTQKEREREITIPTGLSFGRKTSPLDARARGVIR